MHSLRAVLNWTEKRGTVELCHNGHGYNKYLGNNVPQPMVHCHVLQYRMVMDITYLGCNVLHFTDRYNEVLLYAENFFNIYKHIQWQDKKFKMHN